MASRLCWRHVSSSLRCSHFSTSAQRQAASNFLMPAMSPTMTEGNISSWKVKEGDAYAAGDVLLEIETDKATMDVEAQDDGLLYKILVGDGKKGVAVGTNIAVMAEPGDDLKILDMPKEESKTTKSQSGAASQEKETKVEEAPKDKTASAAAPAKKDKSHAPQTNKDGSALSPAVKFLLAQHNISDAHAVPATGPKGRLLKGDVLAFASKIDKSSAKVVADAYAKRGRMDLSNIKKAPMQEKPAAQKKDVPAEIKNPVIEVRRQVDVNHLILLSERISEESGVEVSVQDLTSKAAERALADFPAFATSDLSRFDQTFDEIVSGKPKSALTSPAPLTRQKRATVSLDAAEYFEGGPIKLPARAPASTLLTLQAASPALPLAPSRAAPEYDILDYLTDKPVQSPTSASLAPSTLPSSMIASLSFNEGSVNPEKATIYLDRVSQYIESPAHLFL